MGSKPKIAFFGSDRNSEKVFQILKKCPHFEVTKAPPASIKTDSIIRQVKKYRPDVGVLASYGKILTKELLAIPKHGIINIHPSLLPQYRGPTPVPAAVLSGDKVIGVSIIKIDEEVDHGPLLAQFKMEIFPEDTSASLLTKTFTAGARVLATILPVYLKGQIELKEQNHELATHTPRLDRETGFVPPIVLKKAMISKNDQILIQWVKKTAAFFNLKAPKTPTVFLERFIRAMQPWPGAWTIIKIPSDQKAKRLRLKILKAGLDNKKLVLEKVQLEGKKPVTWPQFEQGYPQSSF